MTTDPDRPEGPCDRMVRLVNESGKYPRHRAFRATDAGRVFLVLLRDKESGFVAQVEETEASLQRD